MNNTSPDLRRSYHSPCQWTTHSTSRRHRRRCRRHSCWAVAIISSYIVVPAVVSQANVLSLWESETESPQPSTANRQTDTHRMVVQMTSWMNKWRDIQEQKTLACRVRYVRGCREEGGNEKHHKGKGEKEIKYIFTFPIGNNNNNEMNIKIWNIIKHNKVSNT